jgi:hypothetical protein
MPLTRLFPRRADPALRHARERAEALLGAIYPHRSLISLRLCASESERFVFAVFYRETGQPVVPGRYCLVAVEKASGVASELALSPDSPYRIKSFK